MKNTLFILLLMGLAQLASAQDRIYTTIQKAPIEGEVTEVSVNEIRYRRAGQPTPIISLDKQDVIKIVYQNGEVLMINNPLKDFTVYAGQKKWNAKLDMLSPMTGYTRLYLEQSQKPGRSAEYELNIIGLGKNPLITSEYLAANHNIRFDARGVGLGYGVKFLKLPDYINGQVRLRHILQGSYIKPAVAVSYYSRNFIQPDAVGNFKGVRKPVFAINPSVTMGKQWILDNTLSIEMYATVGYSFDNVRATQKDIRNDANNPMFFTGENMPFNGFGYTRFSSGDFGLTLNTGFRVGYLFNMKKDKKS